MQGRNETERREERVRGEEIEGTSLYGYETTEKY